MSHRGYSTSSTFLPSRPVFGGKDDNNKNKNNNRNNQSSSRSNAEQLDLIINDIVNGYLNINSRQDSIDRLYSELTKPLLGNHQYHHHNNRHERITLILNKIIEKSESNELILGIIRNHKITQLLIKWLKGESLPHGYSNVNTKKAIMMVLPTILYKSYHSNNQQTQQQIQWPLEFVTAYLWDVTYDSHWNDKFECLSFTQIIRSILCEYEILINHYNQHRLLLAKPFLSKANQIKKEAIFKYETIKNDQITKFRLAMELCCYKDIRNDIYQNIERWFTSSNNVNSHFFQQRFIEKIFSTLQPDIFNDKNLFIQKLLRLEYGLHCKPVLIKNLELLFEAFPAFYEMAINFILNIKPSEKPKFTLLLECIIEATPKKEFDLSQARRKRKKSGKIEFEWLDSYAVTNEDDEEEDEDDDEDEDEDGEIDDEDDDIDMKQPKSPKPKNEYGASLKMHHPSYILGSKMAAAREVHSHRKMCDETLKRFISVKKLSFFVLASIYIFILSLHSNMTRKNVIIVHRFDLCLFSESYLEHISEKSTTKVKKNGITYLNNMGKNLIRAQYFMYRECKRGIDEIINWKLELMKTQDIITQSFVPLSQHFGFSNVCGLLFNFLLLVIYQGNNNSFISKEIMSKLSTIKVVDFQDVITLNEQKKSFQSVPVAISTLDTLFNLNSQSVTTNVARYEIEQYLALISLLMERGLKFVNKHKDYLSNKNKNKHNKNMGNNNNNMLYALYFNDNNPSSIQSLLTKAMGLCKYFPPSTMNVRHLISTTNQNVYRPQQSEIAIIEKYINKLGHIDFFMDIIVIFTLLSCMSLPKCIHHLLKYPTMSQMIHMIILQQYELPFAQTQIDINYERDQEILHKFCYHFIAKDDVDNNNNDLSKSGASSNTSSAPPSPLKRGRSATNNQNLTKSMVKNLTILEYQDRLWNLPKSVIMKLRQYEAQFDISRHLWKYYLNQSLLTNILKKYDYPQIVPGYINHIARDFSIIHSTNLNDPILVIHAMFSIIQNQNKDHWKCLHDIFRKLRSMFYNTNYDKRKIIQCILKHMLTFHAKIHRNGRHSTTEIMNFPHLIFAAICQKSVPYIDFNNMRISLSNNPREQINPCKWLFELRDIDLYLIDILNCITQLLTEQKYTHSHLNAYINFCARCITNNKNDGNEEKLSTMYKFVTVICESLLTYPLAFGSLLKQQNIEQDIQKLVQFGMLNAKTIIPNLLPKDGTNMNDTSWSVLTINNSRLTVLAIKDGTNKTTFKCPLNIIICMLYIIAYCKNPLNGINSWLTFIVSKELKLQILLDGATSNHLQKCLPEELRWKLLLKYDNLQLYCFVYRISNMQSLCNIIPFLLDHKFESIESMNNNNNNSNTNSKPTSAVQMVSWLCNDVGNQNGRFSNAKNKAVFMNIIKPLVVDRANKGTMPIWKKIMTQFKTLFDDDKMEEDNQKDEEKKQQIQVPMLMALFANNPSNDTSSGKDDNDIQMKDSTIEPSENDELFKYLVDTFDCGNNNNHNNHNGNINHETWAKLISKLFCIESDDEKAQIVSYLFDKLLREDEEEKNNVDYTSCIINLVRNYDEYLSRLLVYCPDTKQASITSKIKMFMSKHTKMEQEPEIEKSPEIKNDNPINEWLTKICDGKYQPFKDKTSKIKNRKRSWSQMEQGDEDKNDHKVSIITEDLENLQLLSKMGAFGDDLLKKLLQNTSNDEMKYKILSQLIESRANMILNDKDSQKILPINSGIKTVGSKKDLLNLFNFNHTSDKDAIQFILNEIVPKNRDKDKNNDDIEPPKKKPRKLKLVFNKSGNKGSKSSSISPIKQTKKKTVIDNKKNDVRDHYAEFIADKLSDNPDLFHLLLKIEDDKIRKDFIEKCLEFMCNYFYSPIAGIFMVNQLYFILNKYPSILISIINVLTKHSKNKLMCSNKDENVNIHQNLSLNLLKNREDWFYHHFGLLLCCINIENEYNLSSEIVRDLINSMIVFLENSALQIQHLNESVYLTSLLLIKLSKHYFHFFPDNKRLQKLKQRFKHTKMEKMWSSLQSLDRLNI